MSLPVAITRAYEQMKERNWDSVYWAVDLHGVCFPSTYTQGGYQFINGEVLKGLKAICQHPASKIILWSSCHETEYASIIKFMEDQGVGIFAFNANPEVTDTASGCFASKFYFNIILDDKAGFDPDCDWQVLQYTVKNICEESGIPV